MNLATSMTNKTPSHLLVDSGPSKPSDDCYPGGMEAEGHSEVFQLPRPVPTSQPVELPRFGATIFLQLQEQGFHRGHEFRRMIPAPLKFKGDLVSREINTGEGEASFSQPAALIDGDSPRNLHPVWKIGGFNDGALLVGYLWLCEDGIHCQAQLTSRILHDVVPVDGFKQDLAEDSEIMDGRIPADLAATLQEVVLVLVALAPVKVLEAMFTGYLAGRPDADELEEAFKVGPSAKIDFKSGVFLAVLLGQPFRNPSGEKSITPGSGGRRPFNHFLRGADLSGLTGLMDGIPALSGGLLANPAGIVNELDPPKGACGTLGQPLVERCHNVANVAKKRKKANSFRENKRENENFLQRNPNSWFKSMRGSSSVYAALASYVAENVAQTTGEGRP